MPKRDATLLITDIRDSLDKIARYLHGLNLNDFLGDEKTIDAVVRNLEIIGEAVRQLPLSFKNEHADTPWNEMAGLRNRIVHDYAGIDVELIWEICNKDLPLLKVNIQGINQEE